MAAKKAKTPKSVVEISDLTVRFDRVVLRKLSWEIQRGQHWVLLGANGSGKTTLLLAMAGYTTPTRGEVVVGNKDVEWTELRKRIGLVSASIAQRIEPEETVFDVVLSGKDAMINRWGKIPRDDRKRTHKALRKAEVDHLTRRTWGVLSQGERQRVLIGRALMCKSKLLILDEPCAGLDPVARRDFLAFVERLATQKKGAPTIVFVTHHVEEILPCFTHAALLAEGEFVDSGGILDVMNTPNLRATFGDEVKLRRSGVAYALKVDPKD